MIQRRRSWPIFTEEQKHWAPSVDVYRTATGWVLKYDLADVRPSDVTVAVRGREVSVSGVRRDALVEERLSCYSMEISYNEFRRTIEMPCDLSNARVTLEARDGILLVRMVTEGE